MFSQITDIQARGVSRIDTGFSGTEDLCFTSVTKVVHPLHGAGVIEGGVVERTIDDTPAWYYVLRPTAFGDFPSCFCRWTAAANSGVRPVCGRECARRFLDGLDAITYSESKKLEPALPWLYAAYSFRRPLWVAQVIKSLSVRDHARGLSTGVKKMLEQAMQILESELAFALDRPAERIAEMLREHLCR